MRISILTALVFCGLSFPAQAQQQEQAAALPVGVVAARLAPIAKAAEFVGRVEAINRVEVKARVTGYLEDVLFKEGELVKEGAPLYRIEKGLFQAAVEQARGALERSKATKMLTEIQLQRAQELMDKGAGTVVARDKARARTSRRKARCSSIRPTSTQRRSISATPTSSRRSPARSAGPMSRRATSSGRIADP